MRLTDRSVRYLWLMVACIVAIPLMFAIMKLAPESAITRFLLSQVGPKDPFRRLGPRMPVAAGLTWSGLLSLGFIAGIGIGAIKIYREEWSKEDEL